MDARSKAHSFRDLVDFAVGSSFPIFLFGSCLSVLKLLIGELTDADERRFCI